MGHGWKEYETNKTQGWCVTTGYLTRLLANHPERFDDVTHLIIDEGASFSTVTPELIFCSETFFTQQKILSFSL